MILPKVPGIRYTGYSGHNTTFAKGRFMYIAGVFNSTTHMPLGTAGFSSSGDVRMLAATELLHSGYGVFPVNKLILQLEGADQDTTLDTIASGASLIYYIGGEYETDEYDITVSGTGTTTGTKLCLNSSSQIDTGGNARIRPIGEVVKVSSAPATSRWWTGGTANAKKATVWYRLYPTHAQPGYIPL